MVMAIGLVCMMCFAPTAWGESLTLAEVLQEVFSRHPDVALRKLDEAQARIQFDRIEAQLDPHIHAMAGISDETTPQISDFAATGTRVYEIEVDLAQPLSNGGTVKLATRYNRTLLSGSPVFERFLTLNPRYSNQINLSYRHPFWRGADRPAYHALRIAAGKEETAARFETQVLKEQLGMRALLLFYQLASDALHLRTARGAVDRAKRLMAYQQRRKAFGLIEEADLLQTKALLATRQMELQRAKTIFAEDNARLNRLMIRPNGETIEPKLATEMPQGLPTLDASLKTALQLRPEFAAIRLRMEAVESRLREAMDRRRAQLDGVIQLGTRALGSRPGKILKQGLSINDRFVAFQIEMSDVLGHHQVDADLRQAEIERSRLEWNRRKAIEQAKDDISIALAQFNGEKSTYEKAQQRVQAEKSKFDAELARFREGRSDTATIIQFEGELNAAENERDQAFIRTLLAHRQWQWATGTLWQDLGIRLDNP